MPIDPEAVAAGVKQTAHNWYWLITNPFLWLLPIVWAWLGTRGGRKK
jgi:hypothetical protein